MLLFSSSSFVFLCYPGYERVDGARRDEHLSCPAHPGGTGELFIEHRGRDTTTRLCCVADCFDFTDEDGFLLALLALLCFALQDLHSIFQRQLGFKNMVCPPDMAKWTRLASAVDEVTTPVRIAIVGKYTGLQDSYLSVIKACMNFILVDVCLFVCLIGWLVLQLMNLLRSCHSSVCQSPYPSLHMFGGQIKKNVYFLLRSKLR